MPGSKNCPPGIDHGQTVGEAVGFLEILGREQHGGALGRNRPHDVPHLIAAAGVQAGGGFVEEQQFGRHDQAGGDIQAAVHAA
jgi:hypothetical protein